MENSRRCEICNVDVHRASMQTHLRKKTYLENEKQKQNVIPEGLFKEEQAPIKNKLIKVYNPKLLKQIARERIKINDEELENQLAKKIINPYNFWIWIGIISQHVILSEQILSRTPTEFQYVKRSVFIKEVNIQNL